MVPRAPYTEIGNLLIEDIVMANEHNIIWVSAPERNLGWPEFKEVVFTGAFNEALDYVANLAKNAKFQLGQVLAKDGKVLATIAPQGNIRLSSE